MNVRLFGRQKRLIAPMVAAGVLALGAGAPASVYADETCVSPYSPKITGQEEYAYVWTLGQVGVGDEQDKLVTVDVDPDSETYGTVINHVSVGGRNEAHHSGYTDDRRYLWAGTLDTNKIFIFDVYTDPSNPKLVKTIDDFVSKSGGVVGPHSFFALPGRMIISALSNNADHGGRTALVEYTNDGEFVETYWMPTDDNLQGAEKAGQHADGYGYDVRFLPAKNAMITSSFTGWSNYMMDFGQMLSDPEAMQRFGNTVVVWDLHTRQPKRVLDVPGAPLEIRCAWGGNYCFVTTALTSKIYLIYDDSEKGWSAEEVGTIGNPADGYFAARLCQDSGGGGDDVTDEEIITGMRLLAETEGLFTETAGGVTVATFKKLAEAGKINPDETTVLCITGQGLKTMDALMEPGVLQEAPVIKPTLGAFKDLKIA